MAKQGKRKKQKQLTDEIDVYEVNLEEIGRIERKPEYDEDEWEAVWKLRRFVEERGFSFKEVEGLADFEAIVAVGWKGSAVSRLFVNAEIPDIAEALQGLRHLKNVIVGPHCQDVRWTGALYDVHSISFLGRHSTSQWPNTWASASTIVSFWIEYDVSNSSPSVPASIQQLTRLWWLGLRYSSSPLILPVWLSELPNLKILSLADCCIYHIPYSLVRMGFRFVTDGQNEPNNKQYIDLRGVKLEEGDIGLFSQPREVIEAYYKGREDKSCESGRGESVRECKVIFLGKGGAGKSSLIRRMEFPEEELDPQSLPTNGVSVTKWNVTAPDGPLSLRVMDFGGQEIMHSMHRCFLTSHTVYVIVCDSREDGGVDAEAVMWVEAVKTFAPDCPVILALNKADLSGNVSVDKKDLKRRNPNLKNVLKTSALVEPDHKEYGVKLLENAILQEVPGCMDRMEVSPEWLAVKRELEDMVEKNIDTFTADDYREICIRHNTGDDDALRFKMLGYFKDLGVAYFYNPREGEPNHSLESIRVSNPAWITNGIYRLIIKADDIGFLPQSKIREILETPYEGDTLPDRIYDGEKADFILHVMRMFRISMPFGKNTEMVPMKMPKTPPDSADDYPYDTAIHLRWETSYLPDNLVHRLIIEMSRNLYNWTVKSSQIGKSCRKCRNQRNFRTSVESQKLKAIESTTFLGCL